METVVTVCAVAVMFVTWGMWKETKESVALTRRSVEATEEALRLAKEGGEEAREQAEADRELTRRSVEATEAALRLTEESNRHTAEGVEVSRRSLDFSREALEAAESPWLTPSMEKQGLTPGEPANVILVSLSNTGRSPALNLRGRLLVWMSPTFPEEFPELRLGEGAGVSILGPGKRHELHSHLRALTAREIGHIEAGAVVPYVFGEYFYDDRFGGSHRLRFCYFREANPPHAWTYCPAHNTYERQ